MMPGEPLDTIGMTLNEALARLCLRTDLAPGLSRKAIMDGERTLFVGRAGDAWDWLLVTGRIR
jgi:hypothetical protein